MNSAQHVASLTQCAETSARRSAATALGLAKAHSQSQPMNVSDRIKKLLGITQWSDLLAEGDEPYFGF